MRARLENIPILLGSATPSLESWHNAQRGQYTLLTLPQRVAGPAAAAGATSSTCGTSRRGAAGRSALSADAGAGDAARPCATAAR